MLKLLRTRLSRGMQTTSFPHGSTAFPERFRGLPVLDASACSSREFPEVPTGAVTRDANGQPQLDLGTCLFSPEEAVGAAGCGVRYTHDHRMAVRKREQLLTPNAEIELASALDSRMLALFGRSLRLRSVVAGSCGGCEAELVALGNVVFDMGRFGIQFVASPRHADGIVITGAVNHNMRYALERTYEAVSDPRIVIAVGACAASGGPFRGSSQITGGVPDSIPVDLWIPGCPPHPLTLLDGLLRLLDRLPADGRATAVGPGAPR
jgi:Ni,Fe-hydrogenase III small subunit